MLIGRWNGKGFAKGEIFSHLYAAKAPSMHILCFGDACDADGVLRLP